MEAASTGNTTSRKSAVKLIPKKLGVRGRWRKAPSNESFGSLVSTENEEHPSIPESEQDGSLSMTQSSKSAVENDDGDTDADADAESTDFDTAQDTEHEL